MKNIFNKANVLPLMSGSISAISLPVLGVFAAAPYIAILAPVAALGLGLPFVIGGAIFSIATFALSAIVISKNNTISEKEAQLDEAKKVIEVKDKAITNLNQEKALGSKVPGDSPDEAPSAESQPVKEENVQGRTGWGIDKVKTFVTGIDKKQVAGLLTFGLLAGNFHLVNKGFDIAGNSTAVGNSGGKDVGSHTSSPNSSFTYPNPAIQHPYELQQCKLDEYSNQHEAAQKWHEDNHGISKEGNTNNKNWSQSITGRVFSVPRNLWNSIKGFFGGANNSTNNSSDPKCYQDLYKLEDPEEILDGNVLDNLFCPRVDNGINTSKQQGTFIDSVELKKLTKTHPSVSL